jgi:hypothetical protein
VILQSSERHMFEMKDAQQLSVVMKLEDGWWSHDDDGALRIIA